MNAIKQDLETFQNIQCRESTFSHWIMIMYNLNFKYPLSVNHTFYNAQQVNNREESLRAHFAYFQDNSFPILVPGFLGSWIPCSQVSDFITSMEQNLQDAAAWTLFGPVILPFLCHLK